MPTSGRWPLTSSWWWPYGCILPKSVLEAPKHGCINLHVSLLPKYRGSAPVQWAVLNGDTETGVSIMQMDEGLDTGDVLVCEKIAIGPGGRPAASCSNRVTPWVLDVLCEAVPAWRLAPSGPSPSSMRMHPGPHAGQGAGGVQTDRYCRAHPQLGARHEPLAHGWFVTAGGKKVKVTECRVAASNGELPARCFPQSP